jgi:hypothetical protein
MTTTPSVLAEPPPGWAAVDVPRPEISHDASAAITQWTATRSPAGDATLLAACLSAPIPGWVEDMRAPIEARNVGVMAATAQRLAGVPVEARPDGHVLVLRAAGAPDAPRLGAARTFIGFDAERVSTCFAICAARSEGGARALDRGAPPRAALACDASIDAARLEGSAAPPRPGLALRAVTWTVHHPAPVATASAVLVACASVLAVALRRRPRARARH